MLFSKREEVDRLQNCIFKTLLANDLVWVFLQITSSDKERANKR
jgi:hypothetical protein